jgi:SNF2 family DNA or RNA helicase
MNPLSDIKQGSIIEGPFWPSPVEIKLIDMQGEYVQIIGSIKKTQEHIDQLLTLEDFGKIQLLGGQTSFSEPGWKVFLALETLRYRFASMYDPLLAMNASKVAPLPHQIEAVYGYILKLPRIRFLIADDPGAGKTIMAGLIIKELKLRHLIRRTLIVCPGHLKDQWRRELKERFDESFEVVDRNRIDSVYRENVWHKVNQAITSIDFAKMEDVMPALSAAAFDLVIVDEAHKMSANIYGKKTQKTSRYKLGEVLSKLSDHLLFLTATPHKGDTENFRLFLDLLEPGFFATNDLMLQSVQQKDNPLFIRRVKEDLKDFEGKPLFTPRKVETISFNLTEKSPLERALYDDLSYYVKAQYNKALAKDKKRNIAFALVILQRRFASSVNALLKSLERRKQRLEDMLKQANLQNIQPRLSDYDSVEDMTEEERWQEEAIWETLSVSENREELKHEIDALHRLIEQSNIIIKNEQELKLSELKKALAKLHQQYTNPTEKKILIFTESKDTLIYLEKKIKDWGYRVNTIHGGMKLETRIDAESIFKNETEIMVATEAAGEGINLQFCNLMINYDIPWNPNRLEQRMGRIHRYGQVREVTVFNLVAQDTREGSVLNRLFEKLQEIKERLGSDKVFDVINEVLSNKNLAQLLLEAAAGARHINEILNEINIVVDDNYIAQVKENLGETLASRYIDYTHIKEMADQAKEHRLIPEYTENFFKKAYAKLDGKIKNRQDGFLSVDNAPFPIRKIASEESFKMSYGQLLKKYLKVTFDKDRAFKNPDAEFICFGHPLFEAILIWIETNLSQSLINGATFIDPDGFLNGYILFYEGQIKDGNAAIAGKRLFAFYANTASVVPVSPSIIWDLRESDIPQNDSVDIDDLKKRVLSEAIKSLDAYKKELLVERCRQGAIKEKYGVKSLENLMVKIDGELIELKSKIDQAQTFDLVIRNKEERKKNYDDACVALKVQIQKEKSLSLSSPSFIGIIRVVPSENLEDSMQENAQIEQIGMTVAMTHESRQGRFPEDVSAQNLGYDIRSTSKDQSKRYIEVKARSKEGFVSLTQNEWFKASRFKDDYYLYAVFHSATKPELYIIQNPAEKIKAEEKIEMVRYIIDGELIKERGDFHASSIGS